MLLWGIIQDKGNLCLRKADIFIKRRNYMGRRYASIFLVVCMLLTGFGRTTAYASNEESLEMQYLMEVLGGYLTVNDDLEYTDLFISEQRHIYTFDGSESGKNYYLLISNNLVIAMIVVEKVEESFYSYLTTENIEIISSLYAECEPFALVTINGILIVATEQEYEILVSEYSGTGIQNLDLSDISDKLASVIALDISQIPMVASAGNTYTVTGNPPPHVGNASDPNGRGLCWAACVASVINYRKNNNAETAYSVFTDCWETVDCSEDNIPDGADKWVIIAFEENGINNITYEANSLPVDYIEVLLGTYSKPIIITLYRYNGLNEVIDGHAIVVYEFYNGGGYGYFKVMDPNYSSYITITVPYETLQDTSSFPYVPTWDTNIRYTAWTGSFY